MAGLGRPYSGTSSPLIKKEKRPKKDRKSGRTLQFWYTIDSWCALTKFRCRASNIALQYNMQISDYRWYDLPFCVKVQMKIKHTYTHTHTHTHTSQKWQCLLFKLRSLDICPYWQPQNSLPLPDVKCWCFYSLNGTRRPSRLLQTCAEQVRSLSA